MSVSGIIYFVGSGPGDPALLTVKAAELIRDADLISYDGFVSSEIVKLIPPSAEKISCATSTDTGERQTPEQVVEPLVVAARAGKIVVRLKGGDPWVFGRTDREIRAAIKEKVPFEIIPGVGAATACFAAFGVPLTEKKFSDCLQIRPGHGDNPAGDAVFAENNTYVYLTTENCTALLAGQLIEKGFAPTTPACAISRCTLSDEQLVFATLKTLDKKTANLPPPLLIGVGKGLTKARRIESPPRTALPAEDYKMLDLMIRGLAEFDWVLPDSAETTYILLKRMGAMKKDPAGFDNLRLASADNSIAAVFAEAGITETIKINVALAERLLDDIRNSGPLVGGRFLVPHLPGPKPAWTKALIKAGAIVVGVEIGINQTNEPRKPKNESQEFKSGKKM